MGAQGTTSIDFGAAPGGNYATATVTGQGSILAGSLAEGFIMASTSADHNATEHFVAPIKVTAGAVSAGVGFTLYAVSEWRLTGAFTCNWVWN